MRSVEDREILMKQILDFSRTYGANAAERTVLILGMSMVAAAETLADSMIDVADAVSTEPAIDDD